MSAALTALPPLREVIARHGLSAQKALGQNFLLDLNLTRRIARAAGPLDQGVVLEIGPGPGGLTRALLLEGAQHVVAIERDPRCLPALAEIAAAAPGRLTIVPGDALAIDERTVLPAGVPARVVANLPYHIGTALLVKWLTVQPWPPWYAGLTLMFQREVAQRLAASTGTGAYGRISVLAQTQAEVRCLFDVPARAFTPPPKVTSTIVQLVPRARPALRVPLALLERVTAAAFGQRRKMLRQSLKSLGVPVEALIDAAGLAGTCRAEEIDVAGYARLAEALASLSGGPAAPPP